MQQYGEKVHSEAIHICLTSYMQLQRHKSELCQFFMQTNSFLSLLFVSENFASQLVEHSLVSILSARC